MKGIWQGRIKCYWKTGHVCVCLVSANLMSFFFPLYKIFNSSRWEIQGPFSVFFKLLIISYIFGRIHQKSLQVLQQGHSLNILQQLRVDEHHNGGFISRHALLQIHHLAHFIASNKARLCVLLASYKSRQGMNTTRLSSPCQKRWSRSQSFHQLIYTPDTR